MITMNSSSLLSFFFTVSLLTIITTEQQDETSFSYVNGAPDGPQNWGKLNEAWSVCGTGQFQSPINLGKHVLVCLSSGTLTRNYRPASATIRNRGHHIQVNWIEDAGGILINGIKYHLNNSHWHIPSEHTFNRTRFVMEMHLVHYNDHGDIAVIGILYKSGLPDPFLDQFYPYLISGGVHEEETNVGIVDPWTTMFGTDDYYRYNGSLTTPPCSENVLWTVIKRVKTVSKEQVNALQKAVNDGGSVGNARPVQASNGRSIYSYE